MPLENGGGVIRPCGVNVRVRDAVPRNLAHRGPQYSVITIIVVVLFGTGAGREVRNMGEASTGIGSQFAYECRLWNQT